MSDCDCLPGSDELNELAKLARDGHQGIPYVGSGHPDTVIGCGHDEQVRLGDLAEDAPKASCSGTTASGDPCKGRPGPDGLCAAHKPKEGTDAPAGPPAVTYSPPGEGS